MAPVAMFAKLDNLGKFEDEYCALPADNCTTPVDIRTFDFAMYWRSALREEKYSAEPTPVRMTDGSVPRQSCFKESGPARIWRSVMPREVERDCWTRVLRRSAGWRRVADKQPVARPAKKWNAGDGC